MSETPPNSSAPQESPEYPSGYRYRLFTFKRVQWLVAGLLLVVVSLILALIIGGGEEPVPYGTVLDPPLPTTNFSLQSHRGTTISLEELRGKVVVLTFLYTSCVDVCPFIAQKLKTTRELLAGDAEDVAILAITTDPGRDTLERVRDYSAFHSMMDQWDFLVGTEAELEAVWKGYFIDVLSRQGEDVEPEEVPEEIARPVRGPAEEVARASILTFGGDYIVDHSTPVFVIDQQGQGRFLMSAEFAPWELVHNVRLLLR